MADMNFTLNSNDPFDKLISAQTLGSVFIVAGNGSKLEGEAVVEDIHKT